MDDVLDSTKNDKICRRRSSTSTISSMLSSLQAACSAASAVVQPMDSYSNNNNNNNLTSFNSKNAFSASASASTILNLRKLNSLSNTLTTLNAGEGGSNTGGGGSKRLIWNPSTRRYPLEKITTIYGKNNNKFSSGKNTFGVEVQRATSLKYSPISEQDNLNEKNRRRSSTTTLTTTLKQQQKNLNNWKNDEPEFGVISESRKAQAFCLKSKNLLQSTTTIKSSPISSVNLKKTCSVKNNNEDVAIWLKRYDIKTKINNEPPNEPPPPLPINNNKSNNNNNYNNNNNNINNYNNNNYNNNNSNTPLRLLSNSMEELKKRNNHYLSKKFSTNTQKPTITTFNSEYSTMSLQRKTPTTNHSKHNEAFEQSQILKEHKSTWNVAESPSIQSIIPLKNRIKAYCQAANIQRPIQTKFLQPLKYSNFTSKN